MFHYVVNSRIEGIVRFNETEIVPNEGDFIQLRLVQKLDRKRNKVSYKYIEIEKTEETSTNLRKDISGMLKLKYRKHGVTIDWENLEYEDQIDLSPDFGFIEDYYVPKEILKQNNITSNCTVEAKVVNSGEKWKVVSIYKK